MHCIGGDLGQRCENETALGHSRMRYREIRGVDDQIPIQENIQVERAGGIRERPGAAVAVFDPQAQLEKLLGRQRCFDLESRIQKPRLIGITYRLGKKEGRDLPDVSAGAPEGIRPALDGGSAPAQIGAGRKISRLGRAARTCDFAPPQKRLSGRLMLPNVPIPLREKEKVKRRSDRSPRSNSWYSSDTPQQFHM